MLRMTFKGFNDPAQISSVVFGMSSSATPAQISGFGFQGTVYFEDYYSLIKVGDRAALGLAQTLLALFKIYIILNISNSNRCTNHKV